MISLNETFFFNHADVNVYIWGFNALKKVYNILYSNFIIKENMN